MTLSLLLQIIKEKISSLEGDFKRVQFKTTQYSIKALQEILKEYEKRAKVLRIHTHDSGDGSCPACEAQGISREFLLKRMREGKK